jgi:acyl-coenzyme A synthetase/AMP-(fatty) acid ligase
MRVAAEAYGIRPGDRVLQFSAPTFDISVEQVYATWAAGATLAVMPEQAWTPAEFLAEATRHGVTVANLPAAYWHQIVAELAGGASPPEHLTLRMIMLGAEAVDPTRLTEWRRLFGDRVRLLTGYGLTETVVTSTLCELGPQPYAGRPAVGAALPGRSVYVLDVHGQPVPPGVTGEIHLGGVCLAREYWRGPEATAGRFAPDHLAGVPGARLYRTGDLGRWREDGQLEVLGRIDRQLKVRGLRIEPAEVEAALLSHPQIRAAVAVAYAADGAGTADRLVAFVVAAGGDPVADGSARALLAERLPATLLPDTLLSIPQLPVTAHGKVDHRALVEQARAAGAATPAFVAPRTEFEDLMAQVWTAVLGCGQVGATDDFFALGGHSLRAMRVLARLRRTLGLNAPVTLLLDHPVLADFCTAIGELPDTAWDDPAVGCMLREVEVEGAAPVAVA